MFCDSGGFICAEHKDSKLTGLQSNSCHTDQLVVGSIAGSWP